MQSLVITCEPLTCSEIHFVSMKLTAFSMVNHLYCDLWIIQSYLSTSFSGHFHVKSAWDFEVKSGTITIFNDFNIDMVLLELWACYILHLSNFSLAK